MISFKEFLAEAKVEIEPGREYTVMDNLAAWHNAGPGTASVQKGDVIKVKDIRYDGAVVFSVNGVSKPSEMYYDMKKLQKKLVDKRLAGMIDKDSPEAQAIKDKLEARKKK